jgi:hypothetical protein
VLVGHKWGTAFVLLFCSIRKEKTAKRKVAEPLPFAVSGQGR